MRMGSEVCIFSEGSCIVSDTWYPAPMLHLQQAFFELQIICICKRPASFRSLLATVLLLRHFKKLTLKGQLNSGD